MGYILAGRHSDFRILAHHIIFFDESKEAVQHNLQSRKWALNYLKASGAIGVIPGATVSTSLTPFSRPMDPSWRCFTARMITKVQCNVYPHILLGAYERTISNRQSSLLYIANELSDQ